MEKKVLTVGYEIPGYSEDHIEFRSNRSLTDADVVLFCTDTPVASYLDDTFRGLQSYGDAGAMQYEIDTAHWKKELSDALKAGKTVFLFLEKKEGFYLPTGTKEYKNARTTVRHVNEYTNYEFLPRTIGRIISADGKHVEFLNDPIFSDFSKGMHKKMEYRAYLEEIPGNPKIVFVAKDKRRVLGAVFSSEAGHLVVLPYINYDYDEFTKIKTNKKGVEENFWTADALKFGNQLVGHLLYIDGALKQNEEVTAPPEWTMNEMYETLKEKDLILSKQAEEKIILDTQKRILGIEIMIKEESLLKGLLFEQGKALEHAVIKALSIIGYSAEGYDDGTLELDQIIISPEGHRYIGECEGKDNKSIDITKFRQLSESLSADFDREEVAEKAFGILFGNAERLLPPNERTLDFTEKCKIGANREKIALVRTIDLYTIAKYLSENADETFKRQCRDAIHSSLGNIVIFPPLPPNKV
jgi:hypothetical protein